MQWNNNSVEFVSIIVHISHGGGNTWIFVKIKSPYFTSHPETIYVRSSEQGWRSDHCGWRWGQFRWHSTMHAPVVFQYWNSSHQITITYSSSYVLSRPLASSARHTSPSPCSSLVPNLEVGVPGACTDCHSILSHPQTRYTVVVTS